MRGRVAAAEGWLVTRQLVVGQSVLVDLHVDHIKAPRSEQEHHDVSLCTEAIDRGCQTAHDEELAVW